uniref:Uncharacterized protein n=1 Tax=viral metagenome TaxID=1070528 RepID=A0A6C0ELP4_9ZZZZ
MNTNFNKLSPVDEFELFKNNLENLFTNLNKLVTIIKPLLSNGLNISCNTSKTISDFICSFENKIESIYTDLSNTDLKNLSPINIKNLNKLIDTNMPKMNSILDNKALLKDTNKPLKKMNSILDNKALLKDTKPLKKMNSILDNKALLTDAKPLKKRKQSGGSLCNNYNYITDPINNKKVTIYSKHGLQILNNYIT